MAFENRRGDTQVGGMMCKYTIILNTVSLSRWMVQLVVPVTVLSDVRSEQTLCDISLQTVQRIVNEEEILFCTGRPVSL